MLFLAARGFRCIAHDRRGHGRSSQPWDGNEMDTYADDLATLMAALDLQDAILVGHSTGGGEVARYIGRHGTARVAKSVLIGSVTPIMLKTEANPGGLPKDKFDDIRAASLARLPGTTAPNAQARGEESRRQDSAEAGGERRSRCQDLCALPRLA